MEFTITLLTGKEWKGCRVKGGPRIGIYTTDCGENNRFISLKSSKTRTTMSAPKISELLTEPDYSIFGAYG